MHIQHVYSMVLSSTSASLHNAVCVRDEDWVVVYIVCGSWLKHLLVLYTNIIIMLACAQSVSTVTGFSGE